MRSRASGFTLIELIIVIILLAIVSATAIPRLSGKAGVEEVTLQDQLLSKLRLSQTQAMQNTSSFRLFNVTASGLPEAGSQLQLRLFDHKTSGGNAVSQFWFNAYGQPGFVTGNPATFTQAVNGLRFEISGATSQKLCIESEGYIHPC